MQLLAFNIYKKKSIVFISVGIVQCKVPNSIINDIILNIKYLWPFYKSGWTKNKYKYKYNISSWKTLIN